MTHMDQKWRKTLNKPDIHDNSNCPKQHTENGWWLELFWGKELLQSKWASCLCILDWLWRLEIVIHVLFHTCMVEMVWPQATNWIFCVYKFGLQKKKHINIQHSIYPQHSKYGRWLKLSWWKELFQSNSECFSWTFGWWLEIVTCFIVHADWWWIRISVLSFSYTWYCSTVICGHIDLIKLDGKLDKCI